MARNRQRAKQRQAERRAERLNRMSSDAPVDEEALEEVELYTGAPPQDTGFSESVVEHPPPAPEFDGDDDDLLEAIDAKLGGTQSKEKLEAKKHRPHDGRHHRNRLIGFLVAVWAELQRVEWPDRQTLTMLTGVVLFFVVIMGAYLGLLDAIFSKLIDKIL